MTRALVLGGGGPVGIAWEIGVVAGLADCGIDLAGADRIIGTSAGAIVGAQLAAGRDPDALFSDHVATGAPEAGGPGAPDLTPLMQFMMRRPLDGFPSSALMAELGGYACQAETVEEADFLAGIGRLLPATSGWPERFVCTAVDARTGAFQVWDRSSGIDLLAGVASSCAVPGIYPTVTVGPARYIDGGVRSATNIDLAAGFDEVVVLAVTLQPFTDFMAAAASRELAALDGARGATALVVPDAASLAAFGPNLMVDSNRQAIAEAGRAQGRAEAGRLAALWR